MGGIFGIRYFDNRPINDSDTDTLKSAMARWGPDGSTLWKSDGIALGHSLLFNTPEALFEDQPLQSGPLTMVAEARIDNRPELASQLDVLSSELTQVPDSLLIFRAFQKWGERCVDHLLGDWSFALWNDESKELFVARDHHGITGVHYYYDKNRLVFASSLPALLEIDWVPKKPNLEYVARVLVSWGKFGHETAFENILRLPPAHYSKIKQSSVQTHRYWYLEHTPDLRLKNDQEYVESFLEIYQEAVRCRLRSYGPVAATLSGGLDSGSVSVLAAEEYETKGRRFPVYSSVPDYESEGVNMPRRFGNEAPYIKATSQFAGNIDVKFVQAKHVSPLMAIRKALQIVGEPTHAASNLYWINEILRTAHADGISSLLVGQWGNTTISWSGIRAKGFIRLRQPRYMIKELLKAILPRRWVLSCRLYLSRPRAWEQYSAINPEFAREVGLTKKMICALHDPTFSKERSARTQRYQLILPGEHAMGAFWAELSAYFSLEVRDPTIDKRIMEFCIAIPNEQYRQKEWGRLLIRRAMEGYLPQEVLWNRDRGLQSSDVLQHVREIYGEAEIALLELKRAELARKVLDLKRMSKVLGSVQGEGNSETWYEVVTILLRGLTTGIFLAQFDK